MLSLDGCTEDPVKRTDDGFVIYKEEELKMGEGGGTPLCPFDCDCCISFKKIMWLI